MKFEVKKQIVTPDGEHHESIEAAKAHMWGQNLDVLGTASRSDYEAAIAAQSKPEAEVPARILEIRHAIREVFLAAWPRASKGQPRKAREPTSEAPRGDSERPEDVGERFRNVEPAEGQALTAEPAMMGSRHDDEPGEERPTDEPDTAAKRPHSKKKAA